MVIFLDTNAGPKQSRLVGLCQLMPIRCITSGTLCAVDLASKLKSYQDGGIQGYPAIMQRTRVVFEASAPLHVKLSTFYKLCYIAQLVVAKNLVYVTDERSKLVHQAVLKAHNWFRIQWQLHQANLSHCNVSVCSHKCGFLAPLSLPWQSAAQSIVQPPLCMLQSCSTSSRA